MGSLDGAVTEEIPEGERERSTGGLGGGRSGGSEFRDEDLVRGENWIRGGGELGSEGRSNRLASEGRSKNESFSGSGWLGGTVALPRDSSWTEGVDKTIDVLSLGTGIGPTGLSILIGEEFGE